MADDELEPFRQHRLKHKPKRILAGRSCSLRLYVELVVVEPARSTGKLKIRQMISLDNNPPRGNGPDHPSRRVPQIAASRSRPASRRGSVGLDGLRRAIPKRSGAVVAENTGSRR